MAPRTQRWRPDTCGCSIIETWDPADPSFVRTGQPESKCQDHATVSDEELYGVLHANPDGENRRKNDVRSSLLEIDDITEFDDDGNLRFIHAAEMKWRFEGEGKNRTLHVSVQSDVIIGRIRTLNAHIEARRSKQVPGKPDGKFTTLNSKLDFNMAAHDQIQTGVRQAHASLKARHDAQFGPNKVFIEID